jgi:hypothetical protein
LQQEGVIAGLNTKLTHNRQQLAEIGWIYQKINPRQMGVHTKLNRNDGV